MWDDCETRGTSRNLKTLAEKMKLNSSSTFEDINLILRNAPLRIRLWKEKGSTSVSDYEIIWQAK